MEEVEQKAGDESQPRVVRPFLLTTLCLISFVFFGFLSLLLLLALFYSGTITEILNKYTPAHLNSRASLTFFMLAAFLLHVACLAGVVMMWKMKHKGYILFGISALVIALYQLLQTNISFATTSVYIGALLLFGLYYKKMRSS
jgi:hypothetical protein